MYALGIRICVSEREKKRFYIMVARSKKIDKKGQVNPLIKKRPERSNFLQKFVKVKIS